MNAPFHPLLLCEYQELVHPDKQLLILIPQSGAVKALQQKRMQRDDVVKKTTTF